MKRYNTPVVLSVHTARLWEGFGWFPPLQLIVQTLNSHCFSIMRGQLGLTSMSIPGLSVEFNVDPQYLHTTATTVESLDENNQIPLAGWKKEVTLFSKLLKYHVETEKAHHYFVAPGTYGVIAGRNVSIKVVIRFFMSILLR